MNSDIAKRIKKLRSERGFKQEDIAQLLHVTRQAVSNWENEKTAISVEYLSRYAEIFGISIDELINGEKPKDDHFENDKVRYIVTIIICAVLLVIGIVLEILWKPDLKSLYESFRVMPYITYTLTVHALMAAAAGVLLPSLISLKADIRLDSSYRIIVLCLGVVAFLIYLWPALWYYTNIFNPHNIPILEDVFVFLRLKILQLRLICPFISGMGFFLGLNN